MLKAKKYITLSDIFKKFDKNKQVIDNLSNQVHPKYTTLESIFTGLFKNVNYCECYNSYEFFYSEKYLSKQLVLNALNFYKKAYYDIFVKKQNLKIFYSNEILQTKKNELFESQKRKINYARYESETYNCHPEVFINWNFDDNEDEKKIILSNLNKININIKQFNSCNNTKYSIPFDTLFEKNVEIIETEDEFLAIIYYNKFFYEQTKDYLQFHLHDNIIESTPRRNYRIVERVSKFYYEYENEHDNKFCNFELIKNVYEAINSSKCDIVVDDALNI